MIVVLIAGRPTGLGTLDAQSLHCVRQEVFSPLRVGGGQAVPHVPCSRIEARGPSKDARLHSFQNRFTDQLVYNLHRAKRSIQPRHRGSTWS